MTDEFDISAFEDDFEQSIKDINEAFRGKYKKELNELAGLSREKIDLITPGITDLEKYDQLITLVKKASQVNLSQADLKNQIEKLGNVALKIAEKVPSLAKILLI
jgi:hypothetical protein